MFERKITDMHAWVEERLSAYMDNRLAPDEHAQVESHLRECSRCQANLESLRWTVSLLQQVPAPALARSFALPVKRQKSRQSGFSFTFLRVATVMASLLLCLVVGLDIFSQFRFSAAPTFAPAAQFAAPTQNIALAPAVAATVAPTSAPAPAMAAPPSALSQPLTLPTGTRALRAGAAEAQATQAAQADSLQKSSAPAPTQPFGLRAAITPTLTAAIPATAQPSGPSGIFSATVTLHRQTPTQPLPTPTQPLPTPAQPSSIPTQLPATPTVPGATNTLATQARAQPTREAAPSVAETAREGVPTVRLIEFGLFALAVVLGFLTAIVWRRRQG